MSLGVGLSGVIGDGELAEVSNVGEDLSELDPDDEGSGGRLYTSAGAVVIGGSSLTCG